MYTAVCLYSTPNIADISIPGTLVPTRGVSLGEGSPIFMFEG